MGDPDAGQARLFPASGDRPLAGQAGGPVPAARSAGRRDGQQGLPACNPAAGGRGHGAGAAGRIQGYPLRAGADSPGQRVRLPGVGGGGGQGPKIRGGENR